MSKTPRTDEHLRMKEENGHAVIVSGDFARQLETELADKDKQLAEARAEIEWLKSEHKNSLGKAKNYTLELSGTITKQAGELFAKDKLIEQMREALRSWTRTQDIPLHEAIKITNAALEAVEGIGNSAE